MTNDEGRMTNLRAAIIGGRNDSARRYRLGRRYGAFHRGGDSVLMLQRDRTDGRSAAAEKCAERPGLFGRGNHARKKRDQLGPIRLMQLIGEPASHLFILFRNKCCCDHARVGRVF